MNLWGLNTEKEGELKMHRKVSQCERIIKYIKDFGSITTWQAMEDLGVARLASRIYDLKCQGYKFKKNRVKTKNRYGERTYYDEYMLVAENV